MAYTINNVLTIFYLAGAKESELENVFSDCEEYGRTLEKLKENEKVQKIRELCKLRNACLFEHQSIDNFVLSITTPFEKQEAFKDVNFDYLYRNGWRRNTSNSKELFVSANEEIAKNIETIKSLFPTWLDSTYIKSLFVVKGLGGKPKESAKKVSGIFGNYFSHLHVKKLRVFINFENKMSNAEKYYFNDKLFLEELYKSYGRKFDFLSYVKKNMYEKSKIETFLDGADNINVYVDCENVENDNVLSVINSIITNGMKEKINKIVLVSDELATAAWEYLKSFCSVKLGMDNIEFILVERTANMKSQVDNEIELSMLEAFYEDKIKNFILVSSDSDYKAILKRLKNKDASIFFCIEKKEQKVSDRYVEELVESNESFCSIDDFNKDVCFDFWKFVFKNDFQKYVAKLNTLLEENSSSDFIDAFYENFKYNDIRRNSMLKAFVNKQFDSLSIVFEDNKLVIK